MAETLADRSKMTQNHHDADEYRRVATGPYVPSARGTLSPDEYFGVPRMGRAHGGRVVGHDSEALIRIDTASLRNAIAVA